LRLINLYKTKNAMYSSNVYLILGDWSAIDDVNTLIDVGNDPSIIERIATAPTGLGKLPVEQVIITHNHSDHTGILPMIRELYRPVVSAKTPYMSADVVLEDGQEIRCGDRYFEVIYSPGHSDDSICLYCKTDGVLFVGDTPVLIRTPDSTYEESYVNVLQRLSKLDVRTIYFGHGAPMTVGAQAAIQSSFANICLKKS